MTLLSLNNTNTFQPEIHHRVNNLLQMVQSILNIEENRNNSNPLQALHETRNKIEVLSVLYTLLSKRINSDQADISDLVKNFLILQTKEETVPQKLKLQFDSCFMNQDVLMPFGLFLSEFICLWKQNETKNNSISIDGKLNHEKYSVTITTSEKITKLIKNNRLLSGLAKQMHAKLKIESTGNCLVLDIKTSQKG